MSSSTCPPSEAYLQLVTSHQVHLRGCIFASLANHADAEDVLQRTNLALLRKASDFPEGGNFLAWAIAVAKYEILSFVRDSRRERLVFSDSIIELMCDAASLETHDLTDRQEALRTCLARMPEHGRRYLVLRYAGNRSIQQIADNSGKTVDGVKALLYRLRRKLEQCVQMNVARNQA